MSHGSVKRSSDSDGGPPAKKKISGHWSAGLYASLDDESLHVYSDDKIVIKDKYPKAKHHFLVLPRLKIESLKRLKSDHVPLLEHMEEKGRELAKKTDSCAEYRYGYHSVPSMGLLHLHVISQDFSSDCLKNKKHWNSFTSDYFKDSREILSLLKENGEVKLDAGKYQEMLKLPLKCHKCSHQPKTIPALKMHIKTHEKQV